MNDDPALVIHLIAALIGAFAVDDSRPRSFLAAGCPRTYLLRDPNGSRADLLTRGAVSISEIRDGLIVRGTDFLCGMGMLWSRTEFCDAERLEA